MPTHRPAPVGEAGQLGYNPQALTSSEAAPDYIYGTDDREIRRLLMQHRLWSDRCVAHWLRAGFRDGQRLLDLGSGPGFGTFDLAEFMGPEGHIVAVEPETRYADFLQRDLDTPSHRPRAPITLRRHRAQDLELDHPVHGVYARWVFTFIQDLKPVCARIADLLAHNGAVAILDYFDWATVTWGPRADTLPAIRRAILATFADFGTDPQVGQKLPAALVHAGLTLEGLHPVVRSARPHDALWRWPEVWMEDFLTTVVTQGHLSPEMQAAWSQEWTANREDPAGYFITPTQVEITARKR